jgi:mRNA interferase MazF
MKSGDVVLIRLPQTSSAASKLRPALILLELPGPFQSLLICGISTRLHGLQPDWDNVLDSGDADYAASGLHERSAIRLSYLHTADHREISGVIGRISPRRLRSLRERLARALTSN